MIGLSIRRLLREPSRSGVKAVAGSISGGRWSIIKSNYPTLLAVGQVKQFR